MMNHSLEQHSMKRFSCHGILCGALTAFGLTFLFNLLTLGLGLSLYTEDNSGMTALAFGGFAWTVIGAYAIMFFSGWVAGRQKCKGHSFHWANGMLHGFLVWVVFLVISLLLLSMLADSASSVYFRNVMNIYIPAEGKIETSNKVGLVTLSTFFIFLMAALGSAIGGYRGTKESEYCSLHS